jgi:hypothetical protein
VIFLLTGVTHFTGAGDWTFLDKLEKKKEEAVKESSSGFAASR